MNDTLKKQQETVVAEAEQQDGGKRTLLQNIERSETQRRLRQKRLEWGCEEELVDATAWDAYREPVGELNLWQRLVRKAARISRRWKHVRHEQQTRHFPESNLWLLQILFLLGGVIPMWGSMLREQAQERRRKSLARFSDMRNWLERQRVHPVAFLGVSGAAVAAVVMVSLYTVGVTVTYDGRVVGNVTSEAVADSALENVKSLASEALEQPYTISDSLVQYSSNIMLRKDVEDGAALQAELTENIDQITYGYSLYVGGEFIGATPYEGALEELIQQLINAASTENTVSCTFGQEIEIKEGYVATDKIMNLGHIAEVLYSTKMEEVTYTVQKGDTWSEIAQANGMTSNELLALNPGYDISKLAIGEVLVMSAAVPYLTITVTERERYVEEIPCEIEYTDTADLYIGDYKVISAGSNGVADVVANVTYVNGEESERTVLSSVVLQEPVAEKQLRGTTKRPTWHATGTVRWPASGRVTSKFGPRQSPGGIGSTNHKGLDIGNVKGTPIYAADGGKVTYAGWMSGYGYLVKIDHQNGYVTYYGHCSKLLVKVGDKVPKGTQIAKIGSTGTATGNCLHFEVRYKGVAKNPLNYLP